MNRTKVELSKWEDNKSKSRLREDSYRSMRSHNIKFEQNGLVYDDEKEEELRLSAEVKQSRIDQEYYDTIHDLLIRYTDEMANVITETVDAGIVHIAPILVNCNNVKHLEPKLLKHLGIKALVAGDYVVLEEQILVGVNFTEVSKGYAEVQRYTHEAAIKLKELRRLEDKFGHITEMKKDLAEIDIELKYLQRKDNLEDDTGAAEIISARAKREAYLKAQIPLIEKQIARGEKEHEAEYAKHEEFLNAYKEFQRENRAGRQGVSANFDKNLKGRVEDWVAMLNRGLRSDETLRFMQNPPVSVLYGEVAYYWVMKDKQLGAWRELLGDSKLKVFGWEFPLLKWSKINAQIKKEMPISVNEDFIEEILNLKQLGLSHDKAYLDMKVFCIRKRKGMDTVLTELFEETWKKAGKIIEERRLKNISQNKPIVANNDSTSPKSTNPYTGIKTKLASTLLKAKATK